MDWDIFWQALTAVGTISATITALFITKWQDRIKNRKNMKIIWKHGDGKRAWNAIDKLTNDYAFDYVILELVNIGNRTILITSICFKFNKCSIAWTKYKDINFPLKLNKEDIATTYIQIDEFYKNIKECLDNKLCTITQNIVIVATDSTNKEYKLSTGRSFDFYIKYYEKIRGILK